jgi:hypothetical protein
MIPSSDLSHRDDYLKDSSDPDFPTIRESNKSIEEELSESLSEDENANEK